MRVQDQQRTIDALAADRDTLAAVVAGLLGGVAKLGEACEGEELPPWIAELVATTCANVVLEYDLAKPVSLEQCLSLKLKAGALRCDFAGRVLDGSESRRSCS